MVFRAPRPSPIPVRLATAEQVDRIARSVERLFDVVEENAHDLAVVRDQLAQLQAELESIKRPKRLPTP